MAKGAKDPPALLHGRTCPFLTLRRRQLDTVHHSPSGDVFLVNRNASRTTMTSFRSCHCLLQWVFQILPHLPIGCVGQLSVATMTFHCISFQSAHRTIYKSLSSFPKCSSYRSAHATATHEAKLQCAHVHAHVAYSSPRLHWQAPASLSPKNSAASQMRSSWCREQSDGRRMPSVLNCSPRHDLGWPCGVAHCGDATGWNKQPCFAGMI